jgi:mono/diheme cytochrome c family protein
VKQSFNQSLTISDSHRNTRLQLCLLTLLIVAAAISLPVAAQSIQVPQPSPGLMPNPAAGKALFEKSCASCHGANLQGSDKGPPMLSKSTNPRITATPAFQLAVKNGSRAHHWKFGDMAPVPGLTPDDVAQITAYVRLEQRKAGIQ